MSAGVELDHRPRHGGPEFRGSDSRRHHNSGTDNNDPDPEEFRDRAKKEYVKKDDCMRRAHEAYERGDGAGAKQLSNEGKAHAAKGDELNKKASEAIFNMVNKDGKKDTIDLHGLFVHEAVDFTTNRIREDQNAGRTYLHVIVGQGHHSIDHKQKIKPAIEALCENLGLEYETEENAGRIYVKLSSLPAQHDGYQHPPQQHNDNQQQYYPSQQQHHHGGQNQEEQQYDEIETFLKKLVNKYCCAVM